jgi:hypothetical protein
MPGLTTLVYPTIVGQCLLRHANNGVPVIVEVSELLPRGDGTAAFDSAAT